jgi:hypothetical protein
MQSVLYEAKTKFFKQNIYINFMLKILQYAKLRQIKTDILKILQPYPNKTTHIAAKSAQAFRHVKEPSTPVNYECASKIPCIVPSSAG